MFINTTFPESLMLYFAKEISYVTNVNIAQSGLEYRKALTQNSTTLYKLYTAIKKNEDIKLLEAFFHTVQARHHSFKLYDETDCQIEKMPILILTNNTAQIQKITHIENRILQENITKLVSGTVRVYANNQELQSGFQINNETGIVTFSENITNSNITISAKYFKHVRFNSDHITMKSKGGNSFEVENIAIKTVIN
jgi:uncharacterized protein (TIGR02217 family)